MAQISSALPDQFQISPVQTPPRRHRNAMDLDSDEYGPEVPDRERDDTSTLVGSVTEKDDATLPDASINGDADADLPSADDSKIGLPAAA